MWMRLIACMFVFGAPAFGVAQASEAIHSTGKLSAQGTKLELTLNAGVKADLQLSLALNVEQAIEWRDDGLLDLDWSHCTTDDFAKGSGELNACLRRAVLVWNGEFDVLSAGSLSLRRIDANHVEFSLKGQSFLKRPLIVNLDALNPKIASLNPTQIPSRKSARPLPRISAPSLDDEIHLIAFGDFGTGTTAQFTMAKGLTAFCKANPCDFGLLLGDNFYETGVKSTDDRLFKDYFETPYADINFKFYAALGNHDHHGNITAEIDYTKRSEKWRMPARYYGFAAGNAAFFAIDSDQFDSNQAKWLDSELAASKATWKIVYGHHPVYSYGEHGDTPQLKQSLLPLLKKYGVNLYVAGHDHDKQFIVRDGLQFVIAGTGAKLRPTRKGSYSNFAKSTLGFTYLVISGNELTLRYVDANGNDEYQTKLNSGSQQAAL